MSNNQDSDQLGFIFVIIGIVLLFTVPPLLPALLMLRFIAKIFKLM